MPMQILKHYKSTKKYHTKCSKTYKIVHRIHNKKLYLKLNLNIKFSYDKTKININFKYIS